MVVGMNEKKLLVGQMPMGCTHFVLEVEQGLTTAQTSGILKAIEPDQQGELEATQYGGIESFLYLRMGLNTEHQVQVQMDVQQTARAGTSKDSMAGSRRMDYRFVLHFHWLRGKVHSQEWVHLVFLKLSEEDRCSSWPLGNFSFLLTPNQLKIIHLYNKTRHHIYMLPIAGQTAGPIGLNFFVNTQG